MSEPIKIAVGGDHAGFECKSMLIEFLKEYTIKDFGTYSANSVDYPDFAHTVANAVENGEFTIGILICGSANGVAMTANKHQGIRAAICWNEELAVLAKTHNNANILCIPARYVSQDLAREISLKFINSEFEGGRHANRVDKISC